MSIYNNIIKTYKKKKNGFYQIQFAVLYLKDGNIAYASNTPYNNTKNVITNSIKLRNPMEDNISYYDGLKMIVITN